MTEQELLQENQKLNARLQKAVSVFNEQKATIERLTAERDQAIAKTKAADEQDQLFFEQQQEIETLKSELQTKQEEIDGANADYAVLESNFESYKENAEKDLKAAQEETVKLNGRLEKAAGEFAKQKEVIALFQKQNEGLANCLRDIQDACLAGLQKMQ